MTPFLRDKRSKGSFLPRLFALASFAAFLSGCGGADSPPPPSAEVIVTGPSSPLNTGASFKFTAVVQNASSNAVIWSVVEPDGGSITADGFYNAPALPGLFTVKATSQVDASASGTSPAPVVIPVGHISGYDVGVDYHATGADFLQTAFITLYNQPGVRPAVRAQLQRMADRGSTFISTRIWFVTEPGTTNFGEAWRATFPMTDQEEANLHNYAQDVAAVQGSGGNRLRLDLGMLWLGAADYTRGDPVNGLGFTPLTAAEFTTRVQLTTDKLLDAVTNVLRPDGVPVVDTIYFEGEVMIGAKANQEWFLSSLYPRFVSHVTAAGFKPAVYFVIEGTQSIVFDDSYTDAVDPILNGHRSVAWMYRSLKFMVNSGLTIPSRIDYSCYLITAGAAYDQLLQRILDDADATLPSLGVPRVYGAAETYYLLDAGQRKLYGQAFASQAARNSRLRRVSFWTTPDGGGPGINVAYPFAIEDFYPPPSP